MSSPMLQLRVRGLTVRASKALSRPTTATPCRSLARINIRRFACQAMKEQQQQQQQSPQPVEQPLVARPARLHEAQAPLLMQTAALSIALLALMTVAEPSVASSSQPQFDLSENTEFFSNVARYGRYFVTVMLGTGYVMLRPIASMFKNPVSAILGIALVGGAIVGTKVTLDAMLGLSAGVEMASGNFM